MLTSLRFIPVIVLGFGLSMTGTACASQTRYYSYQPNYRDLERQARANGYREGFQNGQNDARRGRDFQYSRDGDYRNADDGYSRSYGDKETYRRVFRESYVQGYTEGYREIRRAPVYDRRDGNFPGTWPGTPGVYDRRSPAAQNGYRDGLEAGRDDAHDRDKFDPRGSKRYRQGDHDYESRYGSRDEYKQVYRNAFVQGYEQGYRGYR